MLVTHCNPHPVHADRTAVPFTNSHLPLIWPTARTDAQRSKPLQLKNQLHQLAYQAPLRHWAYQSPPPTSNPIAEQFKEVAGE